MSADKGLRAFFNLMADSIAEPDIAVCNVCSCCCCQYIVTCQCCQTMISPYECPTCSYLLCRISSSTSMHIQHCLRSWMSCSSKLTWRSWTGQMPSPRQPKRFLRKPESEFSQSEINMKQVSDVIDMYKSRVKLLLVVRTVSGWAQCLSSLLLT